MKTTLTLLGAAASGAGLAYIADPRLGKRRRAVARDTAVHLARIITRAADISSRDSANRLKGVFEETKRLFTYESVDDEILTERVRTAVGRVSSHPNVEVLVEDGYVTLIGPVVDREERPILKAAKSVKGVCGVTNRMKPYKPLGTMPTQPSRQRQLDIMQSHWAPATRIIAGAIGASAAVDGVRTGGVRGTLQGIAGLALLVRAAANIEFKRIVGVKSGPRADAVCKIA